MYYNNAVVDNVYIPNVVYKNEMLSPLAPTPSLLPGHYAIIKGREEGRGKANGGCQETVLR